MDLNAEISEFFAKILPVFVRATGATVQAKQVNVTFALRIGPQVVAIV